jgi:hypothetical protein
LPSLFVVLFVGRLDDLADDDVKDPLLGFGDLAVLPLPDADFLDTDSPEGLRRCFFFWSV